MAKTSAKKAQESIQEGLVRSAFDKAVAEMNVDKVRTGAIIEAGRKLADIIDTPGWPMVCGRYDNVSPSMFLKYCQALGMSEDIEADDGKKSTLSSIRMAVGRKASNG